MRTAPPALLPLFRSESQVEMLGLLLLQPSRQWTMDDLAAHVGAPVSSIHREVRRALEAGVLVRDAEHRPHRYQAATNSPAFDPLRSLLEMTVGLPDRLRRGLSEAGGVRAAAIHGSWAAGRARPDSDIDLVVVSDGDRREAQRVARRIGRKIGREMDASIMSSSDFDELRRSQNPFLEKIVRGPRIDVIGDISRLQAPT